MPSIASLTSSADLSLAKIPFAKLAVQDPASIASLTHACETLGFFVITGHPVPTDTLDAAFGAARTFFALPHDVKMRYHQSQQTVTPKASRGYTALFEERLGAAYLPPDHKQVFDFGIDRAPVPGEPFTGRNVLPTDEVSPNFSALLRLQTAVMDTLYWPVVRAFALALGLDAHAIDAQMEEPNLIQRVLYYPPTVGKVQPHTDSGLFTLLFQEPRAAGDGDRSLEVLSQDEWRPVQACASEVTVNLGDHFALWSAGRFVSTLHRVRHDGHTDRVSMPLFLYPNINAMFTPPGKTSADTVSTRAVAVANFKGIWEDGSGTGRKLTEKEKMQSVAS